MNEYYDFNTNGEADVDADADAEMGVLFSSTTNIRAIK